MKELAMNVLVDANNGRRTQIADDKINVQGGHDLSGSGRNVAAGSSITN